MQKKYITILMVCVTMLLFFRDACKAVKVNSRCIHYDNFLSMSINSVVFQKYIDSSQHSYLTVITKNIETSTLDRLNLDFDTTDLYNKINISDTIYKAVGKDSVFLIKDKQKNYLSKIDFGCTR